MRTVDLDCCTDKIVTFNPQNTFKESNFSYIDISSVDNISKKITNASTVMGVNAPSRARQLLQTGDILVSTVRPNLNAVAKVSKEYNGAIASTGFCVLRPKNDVLSSSYLYYWVRSDSFVTDMIKKATGASYPAVSDKIIKGSKIQLPSISAQRKIVEILDHSDILLQKDQLLLEKCDKLSLSIFYDVFGDPVSNEKRWEVTSFGKIFKSIRYGTGLPPKYSEKGIPFIRATNIKNGRITKQGMVYLTPEEARKIDKCFIKEGNLIIVRSGVNTGDCGIIPHEYDGALAGYDLILEVDQPESTFYHYLINSMWGQKIIKPLSRRAGQPHLNAEQITNIEFILPPKKLLQQFKQNIDQVNSLINRINKSTLESSKLFKSLMKHFFNK
jgi:type I restriction enzyme, S subunit